MTSFKSKLAKAVETNNSLVCVGLDPDRTKMSASLQNSTDALFEFNKAIIDATADLVCAFKPNSAFYEAEGDSGVAQLKKTCDYILQNYPNVPIILDAKRADIGNTNDAYAKFAFVWLNVDALTIQPYLGREAVQPFLDYRDKGSIILCRTSNPGAGEFQDLKVEGEQLYKLVARNVAGQWNSAGNCSLVVGSTYPEELAAVREIVGPDMDILLPGIGAQGGDLAKSLAAGLNPAKTGLIISSTREIIYASSGDDFAEAAREKTSRLRDEINKYRNS
jgi:orotidine-5'-phosphate decarboxylase